MSDIDNIKKVTVTLSLQARLQGGGLLPPFSALKAMILKNTSNETVKVLVERGDPTRVCVSYLPGGKSEWVDIDYIWE